MLRWQHYTIYLEVLIPTCSKHLYFSQKHSGVIEHDVMFELKKEKKTSLPFYYYTQIQVCLLSWYLRIEWNMSKVNPSYANQWQSIIDSLRKKSILWDSPSLISLCIKASWERQKDGRELEALAKLSINCTTVEEKSTLSHMHDPVLMVHSLAYLRIHTVRF